MDWVEDTSGWMRRGALLPALALLGAALGYAFTLFATPHYLSATRLDLGTGNAGAMGGIAPYLETQHRLLVTRTQARRVVRAFRIDGDTAFASAFGGSADEGETAERLRGAVSVYPVGGSTLVDIAVQTPDPQLSARLANSWATEFARARSERAAGSGEESREALEKEIADQREKLSVAEKAVFDFAQATGIVAPELLTAPTPVGSVAPPSTSESAASGQGAPETSASAVVPTAMMPAPGADVAALKEALSRATITRIEAETALSTPDPGTARAVARLQDSLADSERELAEMRANFDSAYPPLADKEREVARIERAITAARSGNRGQLEAARADAVRRESALRSQLTTAEQSFFTQQQGRVQYSTLARAAQEERQLYEGLLERRQELALATSGERGIAVINPARPVPDVHWPSGWRTALLGGAIGFFAGLLALAGLWLAGRRESRRSGWKAWRPG